MEKHSIGPENTRIRKLVEDGNPITCCTLHVVLYVTYLNIGVDGPSKLLRHCPKTRLGARPTTGPTCPSSSTCFKMEAASSASPTTRRRTQPSPSTSTSPSSPRTVNPLRAATSCTCISGAALQISQLARTYTSLFVPSRVSSKPRPRWKFVQPNRFLRGEDEVEMKLYEASNRGWIQSWAEMDV